MEFKREFPFEAALRLFEVISSHYLELNSDKALVETDKVIAKEFEHDSKLVYTCFTLLISLFTSALIWCALFVVY